MFKINMEQLHRAFLQSQNVSIDTRTLKDGDIFFALKGPNFDGNTYAKTALDRGAQFVVVDDPELNGVREGDIRYILVPDTLDALQALASFHRDYSKAKIIGITGSNGKTTTKELLAAVLSEQFKIIYTKGNLNNHIGVPLTLLSIRESTEIAIVEMGANHQGEIAELSAIAKPHYGLITNIGTAHIEGFGSLDGIKKGKGELFQAIKERQGHLFVNKSDKAVLDLAGEYKSTILFSQIDSFDGVSIDIQNVDGSIELEFEWDGGLHRGRTNLYGEYNVPNLLAALNIGYYFNIAPPIALRALEKYIPENSRSQRLQTEKNEIFLDAYNANPTSMRHALESFERIKTDNKVVVLGDMFELGEHSQKYHQEIADLAAKLFSNIFLVGIHFSKTKSEHIQFDSCAEMNAYLKNTPIEGSTVLLKGSRGMTLEKLLDNL